LPDLEEVTPRMDEVMVANADIPKELTGFQGVVEVEIPHLQRIHWVDSGY
jgi:hypothetical protein